MNRADRIRRVIPSAPDELITGLANRPLAEVDQIIAALRLANHEGAEAEKARRKRARRRRRQPESAERAQFIGKMLGALAEVIAEGDPGEALVLMEIERQAHQAVGLAFHRMHQSGLSYAEIAAEVGVVRQAVHQRITRALAAADGTGPATLEIVSTPR